MHASCICDYKVEVQRLIKHFMCLTHHKVAHKLRQQTTTLNLVHESNNKSNTKKMFLLSNLCKFIHIYMWLQI